MSKKTSKKSKKASTNKLLSKYSHRSLDAEWEKVANLCLFSFIDDDGEEIFVSSEEERAYYGQGHESTFRDYPVFAPDEIVCRVAGKIGKAKSAKETLIAWIDGSYSFSEQKGCCAYSVFFQVGDRIAEYANTVYDGTRRYGATASELMAAIVAIKVAVAFGYSKINLRHDYTGVAFFSDDAQVEPNKRSKMYWIFAQYNAFLQCARDLIDISYTKIKGHSLDVGNEHADFLARTYSKRGRNRLERHAHIIEGKEKKSTPQIDAFAERYQIGTLSLRKVIEDMEAKDIQESFGFTEIEYTVVHKMLHETSTEDICSQTLLNRKSLSEKRRNITEKLGMQADAASDNTIVRLILEWLYLDGDAAEKGTVVAKENAGATVEMEHEEECGKRKDEQNELPEASESGTMASARVPEEKSNIENSSKQHLSVRAKKSAKAKNRSKKLCNKRSKQNKPAVSMRTSKRAAARISRKRKR